MQQTRNKRYFGFIVKDMFFLSFFFFGHDQSVWKFQNQGLNPYHSSDNAQFFTHLVTGVFPKIIFEETYKDAFLRILKQTTA